MAALVAVMSALSARAEDVYQRRATWQQTVVEARVRLGMLLGRTAGESEARLGRWYVTRPLESRSLADAHFPERGVSIEATDDRGRRLWTPRPEWVDGRVHGLETRNHASTYLYRTITVDAPRRARVYLGSDDGLAVFLDGSKVYERDAERGAEPDQETVELDLKGGENRFLLKIHNQRHGHAFYFSMRPRQVSSDVLLHVLERDFPIETDWVRQDASGRLGGLFLRARDASFDRALIESCLRQDHPATKGLRDRLRSLVNESVGADDPRWLDLYIEACEARRAARLEPLIAAWKSIVFTKHYNLGGSHYAYTEGQSDAQSERHFVPGSALCLLTLDGTRAKVETLLEDPKGVIRDPDVSHDGKRILFAWKKSDREDDYHLYEMSAESRTARQLTSGLGFADYEGAYLPDGGIVFSSTRPVQTVDCWWTEVSNIYTCDGEGKFLRRLGFDQVHTNYPTVTHDGRVIYTRWEYSDRGQLFPQPLFQMNPDGTAQTELYGNNSWFPTTILHARGIPGTTRVVAIATGHHTLQAGKLVLIDPAKGRQENEGVTLLAPSRNAEAVRVDQYGQDGELWQYPYPLDENSYLVSYAPDGWSRKPTRFGVYFATSDGARELLVADPKISCNQPVPLAPRGPPHVRPSVVDYRKDVGMYYVHDVYAGGGMEGVERGTVTHLRVVAIEYRAAGIGQNGNHGPAGGALVSTPVAIDNGTWDVKRVIGQTPVCSDGSVSFSVPARTPVYFQLVDANGCVVQTMRSWSTLQPGEALSCVGCHEPKNAAPPAYLRPTEAMRGGVRDLEPFAGLSGGFSFPRDVQPILDRNCVRCHSDRARRPRFGTANARLNRKPGRRLLERGSSWRYTTEAPPPSWHERDFDDDAWSVARSPFGLPGTPGADVATRWDTPDIWMRTTIDVEPAQGAEFVLDVIHDEDVEVYINGVSAARVTGYVTKYQPMTVARRAQRSLRAGANTIAVHCRQTLGGQVIDVSLQELRWPEWSGADEVAFSLRGEGNRDARAKRAWSDSYLALTQRGSSNRIVSWISAQSVPPMLEPYHAGAARSGLVSMLDRGHGGVKLPRRDLDVIKCWIDLLVPYCGTYTEANTWTQEEKRKYAHFASKREGMEEIERRNIRALIESGR